MFEQSDPDLDATRNRCTRFQRCSWLAGAESQAQRSPATLMGQCVASVATCCNCQLPVAGKKDEPQHLLQGAGTPSNHLDVRRMLRAFKGGSCPKVTSQLIKGTRWSTVDPTLAPRSPRHWLQQCCSTWEFPTRYSQTMLKAQIAWPWRLRLHYHRRISKATTIMNGIIWHYMKY